MKPFLLTITLFFASFVFSQNFSAPVIITNNNTKLPWTNVDPNENLHSFDADNNGLADIVCIQDSKITLIKNLGNQDFSNHIILDSVVNSHALLIGDLNNNNFKDIVYGRRDSIFVLKNFNGNFTKQFLLKTNNTAMNPFLASGKIADINNDNLQDIIVNHLNIVYVLTNQGNFNFSVQALGFDSYFDTEVKDINNNGFKDLIIAGLDGITIHYNNNGLFNTVPDVSVDLNFYFSTYVNVSDYNNDGKPDILTKQTFNENAPLQLLLNDGSGNFTTVQDLMQSAYDTVQPCDIDQDGDMDILSVNNNSEIIWLENDGNGNFGSQNIIDSVNFITEPYHLTTGDFNNNGYPDLLYYFLDNNTANTTFNLIIQLNNETLSVSNNNLSNNIIYPNPASDFINIKDKNAQNIKIYNTLGKIISQYKATDKINISNFTKGIYFIKINDKEIYKFIKK